MPGANTPPEPPEPIVNAVEIIFTKGINKKINKIGKPNEGIMLNFPSISN